MCVAATRWLTHASPGVIRRLVRLVRDPADRGIVGLLGLGGLLLLLGAQLLRVGILPALRAAPLRIGRRGQQRDASQGDDDGSHAFPQSNTWRALPLGIMVQLVVENRTRGRPDGEEVRRPAAGVAPGRSRGSLLDRTSTRLN